MSQHTDRSVLRYSLTYGSDIRVHVPKPLTVSAEGTPVPTAAPSRSLLATFFGGWTRTAPSAQTSGLKPSLA